MTTNTKHSACTSIIAPPTAIQNPTTNDVELHITLETGPSVGSAMGPEGTKEVEALCESLTKATRLCDHFDLSIGATYQGENIPLFHRVISLPEPGNLDENSEYVMVNKCTGKVQHYDVSDILNNIASIFGISVLILNEASISNVKHGVLHSSHLGQPCFVASGLQDGLCLTIYEELMLKFKKRGSASGKGYHCLVVPVEAMTLDEFVSRFASRKYWQVCSYVAGGQEDNEKEKDEFDQMSLLGVDTSLGKLLKLMNAFGASLRGSPRRLVEIIRSRIVSRQQKNWDDLIENRTIATCIKVLLHHFCRTLDPHKHVSSSILNESLQDSLNLKYGFQDEWEIVDVAEHINKQFYSLP